MLLLNILLLIMSVCFLFWNISKFHENTFRKVFTAVWAVIFLLDLVLLVVHL